MKTIYTILCGTALLSLAYCKSTKTTAKAAPAAFEVSDKQLSIAQGRWPGATAEDIRRGHNIYTTRCVQCHGNFEITRFSEKKWLHEIDDMAPKANLLPEEKLDLTKHII